VDSVAGPHGPELEVGKRTEWAEVRRSQEIGGTPVWRCMRKGLRALVDESVRSRGAEGTGRWDRCDGRGGNEWLYKLEIASGSTGGGGAISTCEAIHVWITSQVGSDLYRDYAPKLSPQL
jgi:hypothetical protein